LGRWAIDQAKSPFWGKKGGTVKKEREVPYRGEIKGDRGQSKICLLTGEKTGRGQAGKESNWPKCKKSDACGPRQEKKNGGKLMPHKKEKDDHKKKSEQG